MKLSWSGSACRGIELFRWQVWNIALKALNRNNFSCLTSARLRFPVFKQGKIFISRTCFKEQFPILAEALPSLYLINSKFPWLPQKAVFCLHPINIFLKIFQRKVDLAQASGTAITLISRGGGGTARPLYTRPFLLLVSGYTDRLPQNLHFWACWEAQDKTFFSHVGCRQERSHSHLHIHHLQRGRTTEAFDDCRNTGDTPSHKESLDRTPAIAQHILQLFELHKCIVREQAKQTLIAPEERINSPVTRNPRMSFSSSSPELVVERSLLSQRAAPVPVYTKSPALAHLFHAPSP